MSPKEQRQFRNQFSDLYWRAKKAINIGAQSEAIAHLQSMTMLFEKATACFFDDSIVAQFERDITLISHSIRERR